MKWAYDGIVDDIVSLEKAKDGVERRDQLMRETLDELATMAELSTGTAFTTTGLARRLSTRCTGTLKG